MDKERLSAVEIGETTMLADMTKCLIAELKVMSKPWQSISAEEQDDVIERMQKQLKVAAQQAINIIASRNMSEVTGMVEVLTFKDGAKATIKFNGITEGVHSLADAVGHFVKIIIPETEDLINEAGMPKGEADQRILELGHEYDESEKDESYDGEPFITTASEDATEKLADALAESDSDGDSDPLYEEAVALFRKSGKASIASIQRPLKIGYNRAVKLIEAMELAGVVSELGGNFRRTVIAEEGSNDLAEPEAEIDGYAETSDEAEAETEPQLDHEDELDPEEDDNSLVVSTAQSDLEEEEHGEISTGDSDDEADAAGDVD